MKRVLIFEANSNQAISLAKYLKGFDNFSITGVIASGKASRFLKRYYDRIIFGECSKIDREGYDYIVPTGAKSSYEILSQYKKLFFENGIVMCDKNLQFFNKPHSLELAKELAIPIPQSYPSREEIERFPIFFKERFESGGGVRGIARSALEIPKRGDLIFQEYIDTPSTYGVGFLAIDGEIVTATSYKEVISYPKEGGSAIVVDSFEDPRLLEYTKRVLKRTNYSGWGLAEFKYCKRREDFVFMEVNAKLWASLEFVLLNNQKFLELLFGLKGEKRVSSGARDVIYLDRLLSLEPKSILKNSRYLFGRKVLYQSNIFYLVLRKMVPDFAVDWFKGLLK